MVSILEGELAEDVAEALSAARVPMAITVRETIPGSGPPYNPGPPTYVNHACEGWPESYADAEIDGTRITQSDVRVLILTTSLAMTPTTSDHVIVGGTSHTILNIKRDASGALLEIQARA
jgi:hypothetical protein